MSSADEFAERPRRWDADALKALGCVMVVFYHANALVPVQSVSTAVGYYLQSWLTPCVPLFFFVTGCLYARSAPKPGRRWRKAGRLVVLTTAWAFLSSAVMVLEYGQGFSLSLVAKAALGLWNQYTTHLWYLQKLVVILLALPFLLALRQDDERMFRCAVWGAVAIVLGTDTLVRLDEVAYGLAGFSGFASLKGFVEGFSPIGGPYGFSFLYLLLGMLLGGEGKPAFGRRGAWAAVLLAPAAMTTYILLLFQMGISANGYDPVWLGFTFISAPLAVVGLYSLLAGRPGNSRLGRLASFVGRNSMAVYLLHPLVVYKAVQMLPPVLPWWGMLFARVALCLIVVAMAALAGELCRRWRVTRWLFSA